MPTKQHSKSWAGTSLLSDVKGGFTSTWSGASSHGEIRPRKYRSIIISVCLFILVTEFCERLAYYGLTGSLPIYFHKELKLKKDFATELSALFSSFNYITPLLGAYLADKYWGRFKTIFVFCCIYVLGMATCVMSAWPGYLDSHPTLVTWTFLIGLFGGVAVGSGGIKPNVVTLGADQFDVRDPSQNAEKERFFNYFYWCINIGATFSFGYLTTLAINGEPSIGIPKRYGFFASFVIPGIAMILAVIIFFGGSSRYFKLPPSGSAFTRFFRVFMKAGRNTKLGKKILTSIIFIMIGMLTTIAGFFISSGDNDHFITAVVGMLCIGSGLICLICVGGDASWIRDGALQSTGIYVKNEYTRQDVEDAYQVARLLPYLALITMFWACYGQMNNNFVIQGCQMDLRHWFGGRQVSSAFLSLFDSLVIMIFIPIFDFFIYPAIETCRGGRPLTVLQKIGAGFVFCCLSMSVAGWIEILRKQSPVIFVAPQCAMNITFDASCADNSECAPVGQIQDMHKISIWWQSAQYTLIGIGEILTSISSYELFYSQVPASMRSVCQGLNLLTTSIGFMVTGGINSVFSFWITNDLDMGHLEYVYWLVAMLTAINLAAFLHVSQSFEYTVSFNAVEPSEVEYSSSSSSKSPGDEDGESEKKKKNDDFSKEEENPNERIAQESSLSPNWSKHPSRAKWRRKQLKERAKSMFF